MNVRVTKSFEGPGKVMLQRGEVYDASDWRNLDRLLELRYVVETSNDVTHELPAVGEAVTVLRVDDPSTPAQHRDRWRAMHGGGNVAPVRGAADRVDGAIDRSGS